MALDKNDSILKPNIEENENFGQIRENFILKIQAMNLNWQKNIVKRLQQVGKQFGLNYLKERHKSSSLILRVLILLV